jgi:hypothetical protein
LEPEEIAAPGFEAKHSEPTTAELEVEALSTVIRE